MTKAQLIAAGWLLLGYCSNGKRTLRLALDPSGAKHELTILKDGRLKDAGLIQEASSNHAYLSHREQT